jgi:hypothetical protein
MWKQDSGMECRNDRFHWWFATIRFQSSERQSETVKNSETPAFVEAATCSATPEQLIFFLKKPRLCGVANSRNVMRNRIKIISCRIIMTNYINTHNQAGEIGLKKTAAKNMPIIIMEPSSGGKLMGGVPPKSVGLFKQAPPSRVLVVISGMNGTRGSRLLYALSKQSECSDELRRLQHFFCYGYAQRNYTIYGWRRRDKPRQKPCGERMYKMRAV